MSVLKPAFVYAVFIGLMLAVGGIAANLFPPGPWYDRLDKPWFNPPTFVFPIAWTLLFILIGIAGGRVWMKGLLGLPFLLWLAQLGLNGFWSYLFFGLQSPGLALIEVVVFFAVIVGFILATWREDKVAALLFVPYLAWVGFATVLNATIWWMNGTSGL